jgi:hypothetical protein
MKQKKHISVLAMVVIAVIILLAYLFASGKLKEANFPTDQLPAQASLLATPVVTATNLTCSSVKLQWGAVPNARGYEVYGPSSVCNVNGSAGYCGKTGQNGLSKNITGLAPSTTYAALQSQTQGFTVLAYRNSNYSAASPRLTVTTPACGVTIPTITITSPTSAATYTTTSAGMSLGGTATNATSVKWSINNGAQQFATGSASWSVAGISLVSGTNTIVVTAYDASGNASTPDTLVVTYNAPTTDTIAPTTTTAAPSSSWATTNISRTLTCTDTGGSGCAATYWKFVQSGTTCPTGPVGYTTGTTASTTAEGSHRLCYYSTDGSGNVESPIKFQEPYKLDSSAPTGSITAPTPGASVSGTVNLTATVAIDSGSGTASVVFKIDGAAVATDTSSPYTYAWNSTTVANGSHTVTATLTDNAGNTTTTTGIVFSVSNAASVATPTGLNATALSCNAFTLNWNPVANATGYEIYGPTGCNGNSGDYCGLATTTSKAITGLTPSTAYDVLSSNNARSAFTVLAYTATGAYSQPATRLAVTTPSCPTNAAPTATITSPTTAATYTTTSASVTLAGAAADDASVASVTWANQANGSTGSATGTTSWSTGAITLAAGANTIVVTARDAQNATGTDTITVTYNPVVQASAWPASTTGSSLVGGTEPSGAFWNPADQMLYFVSDSGTIAREDQNGGNYRELGSGLGNLEGVTGTSSYNQSKMGMLYVIDENLVRMREYNPYATATSGAFTGNYWNLTGAGAIPAADVDVANNNSIEGVTFVPNEITVNSYGTSTSGGLFYVSSQLTGKIYVLDIDLAVSNSTPVRKGTIIPNLITTSPLPNDISDLYYATATNKLFVLYDANGVVHEMRANGAFVNEYYSPIAGRAGEGITTVPTCGGSTTAIVLAYDQGTVSKYASYPQPCVDTTGPVLSSTAAAPTSGTAVVTWNSDEYSDSTVEYGIGNYNTTLSNLTLKATGHTVVLSGLVNGNYQYRVKSKDQVGNFSSYATGTFTIGAVTVDPIIYAAGDIALNGSSGAQQTSNWMLNNLTNVGAILTLGDNVYDSGTLSEYNSYYAPAWGRSAILNLTKPVPGNHEYYTANGTGYFDYFNGVGVQTGRAGTRGQGYYSYNVGNWHLIALNTNEKCTVVSCSVGSAQETWLRNDLAANAGVCTIAYDHHPRFSLGDHGDTTAVQPLWDALADNNVEVFLSGHDHGYERKKRMNSAGTVVANGVRQFVVGTGGTNNWYPIATGSNQDVQIENTFGVLKLTLRTSSYDWAFVRTSDGAILDAGSESCY